MRLIDAARLAGEHGARRWAEKRGHVLPIVAGGLLAANHGENPIHRGERVTHDLDRASRQTLAPDVAAKHATMGNAASHFMQGGGVSPGISASDMPGWGHAGAQFGGASLASMLGPVLGAPGKALADRIQGALGPQKSFGERKDPMHMFATNAITSLGSGVATMGLDLLRDIALKAQTAVGNMGQSAARTAILSELRKEDPILSEAEDKPLMEAYHTMSRFAPVLSTDKNAVRSFLRQAVMSGSGVDFASIKLLGDAERSVTNKGDSRRG